MVVLLVLLVVVVVGALWRGRQRRHLRRRRRRRREGEVLEGVVQVLVLVGGRWVHRGRAEGASEEGRRGRRFCCCCCRPGCSRAEKERIPRWPMQPRLGSQIHPPPQTSLCSSDRQDARGSNKEVTRNDRNWDSCTIQCCFLSCQLCQPPCCMRLRQVAATRPLPITPSHQQEMTSQAAGDSSLPASVPIPDLSDPSLADWREEQVLNLRMSWNSKVTSHTLLRLCSAFLPVGLGEGLTRAFGG